MQAIYPVLSLISVVLFVWLGRRLATTRNRNTLGWSVAGGLLPPALLVLWLLKPLAAAADGNEETA